MRWTLSLAALPSLALLLLAGCAGPDFRVPPDADATADILPAEGEAPAEPFTLAVQVRREHAGGEPVTGVGVVVFGTSEDAAVEYARTDAAGNAALRFFVGGTASVAVGGADGLTTEEALDVALGPPGETRVLEVFLYDQERTLAVGGSFPLALGLPGQPAAADVAVDLAADPAVEAAYLDRLVGLDVTLAWTNSPTASGDLHAAVRSGDGAVQRTGGDERQLPADGAHEEELHLGEQDARALGWAAQASGLHLRAASRGPVVAVDALAFTFEGTATFRGSDLVIA